MKLSILALAVLALPALGQAEEAKTEVVALKAARLFSGKEDSTIRDAVVIVEGRKIKAVGSGLQVPAGARVVDLGDATILPVRPAEPSASCAAAAGTRRETAGEPPHGATTVGAVTLCGDGPA